MTVGMSPAYKPLVSARQTASNAKGENPAEWLSEGNSNRFIGAAEATIVLNGAKTVAGVAVSTGRGKCSGFQPERGAYLQRLFEMDQTGFSGAGSIVAG